VASAAGSKLFRQEIDLGPLGEEEVEVAVEYCGVCHSDLSMLHNEWGFSHYPAVLGHEVVGRVVAVGAAAEAIAAGQRVGVAWTAGTCMNCRQCMSGDLHLCAGAGVTLVGHKGGFASRVRSHWAWAVPIPENLREADVAPLLCAGVTIFNPLVMHAKPASRVGVVGIGGFGRLALEFAAALGCEVIALTSSEKEYGESPGFGAHRVVSSRDPAALQKLTGTLDLLLVTVNVVLLDWRALLNTLTPAGRMHFVGAVPDHIPGPVLPLILGQRSIGGSPSGSPALIATMLEFAARHKITPQTEHFPMSRINEAFAYLEAGRARYRIVLDADFDSNS
jgi:uncharacterized zinc-type alcohol dehydrogenase-like protein